MSQPGLFGSAEERRLDLSQWYTPPEKAKLIWEWSRGATATRILETSAGQGALIAPSIAGGGLSQWTAYEIDPRNVEILRAKWPELDLRPRDFTMDDNPGSFDLAIMNPPYEGELDVAHVLHALRHCNRVVALLRSAFSHGGDRWDAFWRWVNPTRKVTLAGRPKFGGGGSPKSDFCLFEFSGGLRSVPREYGEEVAITECIWP